MITDVEALGQFDTLTQWSIRPPGGECMRDVALRVLGWLASEDDGVDTLVVAHGVVIRSLVGLLDRRPYDQIGLWKPRNCEAVRRDVPPGTWAALRQHVITSSG
jgi:broad specificity phosphatase PhoE